MNWLVVGFLFYGLGVFAALGTLFSDDDWERHPTEILAAMLLSCLWPLILFAAAAEMFYTIAGAKKSLSDHVKDRDS